MFEVDTKIRIEPYLLSTGKRPTVSAQACPAYFSPAPKRVEGSSGVGGFNSSESLNLRIGDTKLFNDNHHASEYGLRLKIVVGYKDSEGQSQECRGSMDFSYNVDVTKPSVPQDGIGSTQVRMNSSSITNTAEISGINTANTSPTFYNIDSTIERTNAPNCSGGIPQDSVDDFTLTLRVDRDRVGNGNTILCRDASRYIDESKFTEVDCHRSNGAFHSKRFLDPSRSAPDIYNASEGQILPSRYYQDTYSNPTSAGGASNWVPCDQVRLCGKVASNVSYSEPGSSVELELDYTNMPKGCLARLEYTNVDMAGNISDIQRVENIVAYPTCGSFCSATYISTKSSDFYQCGSTCPCDDYCNPSSPCHNANHASCVVASCDHSTLPSGAFPCYPENPRNENQAFSSGPGCTPSGNDGICDWTCHAGRTWNPSTGICEEGEEEEIVVVASCDHSTLPSGAFPCSPENPTTEDQAFNSAPGCSPSGSDGICDWICHAGRTWNSGTGRCELNGSSNPTTSYNCTGSPPSGGVACSVTGLTQNRTYRSSEGCTSCLLYTSPSPRDATLSRMPSSA